MKHNLIMDSLIVQTDSYKVGQHLQYVPNLENLYSYFESRGGSFPETTMFGLNYYLKRYLSNPITMEQIDYAEKRFNLHFGNTRSFNRKGWERIVTVHNGMLPLVIKAAPEGLTVPTRNVLFTITNTDPQLPWLTNYMETLLSKIWYPITVCTHSREMKKLILKYLEDTGTPESIDFKLHDFGYRGVSCEESAMIGGMAHLVNFKGTDTFAAVEGAWEYYNEEMAGFSINAAEHSTITSWGEAHEYEAYQNMIKQFGNDAIYAVVSDSYNIFTACDEIWGKMLKQQVLDAPGILVIRPDSGVPHEVDRQVIETLGARFGYTTNDKGYKVLNKVRVIQGDGIDRPETERILEALKIRGWSADNISFGSGGALLQKFDRDTCKFALKASSETVKGEIRDVFKSPVTDNGKRSKKGMLKLIYNTDGVLETVSIHTPGKDVLETVWENGKLLVDPTFAEIRERAAL